MNKREITGFGGRRQKGGGIEKWRLWDIWECLYSIRIRRKKIKT